MNTLQYILDKYQLEGKKPNRWGATEIPNVGRRQLPSLFQELGFMKGVEIGVANGWFSNHICKNMSEVELYGVDPYEKQEGYIDFQLKSTFERMENEAHSRLDQFPNYHFLRKTSAEALSDFADGSLDFVYVDGDHCFEAVTFDIAKWSKKICKGGIISGHDFARHRRAGTKIHVVEAVNGYTDAYKIKPWFILGNEANDEGLIRDRIRSWFWII